MKRKILVTGASGFIGKKIVNYFSSDSYQIIGFGRRGGVSETFYQVDLGNRHLLKSIAKDIESPDVIIHCAALAHGQSPPFGGSIQSYNSLLLQNMLDAFPDKSIHWIFISSVNVYGIIGKESPVSVFSEPSPVDGYGVGKLYDENKILRARARVDVLRLAPVYSSEVLDDLKKRVYFPRSTVKIKILPTPCYSFCEASNITRIIERQIEVKDGRFLTLVADEEPITQAALSGKFKGPWLPFPRFLGVVFLQILASPFLRFQVVSYYISKLIRDNVFIPGQRNL